MATNRRDVQLVVRAKDEAGKAFESAAQALEKLLSVNDAVGASAGKTGDRLQDLAALALTLDKAYTKISGSADAAAASFARQQAAITEQRAQLSSLEGQAAAAAKAIERLKSAEAIVDAGRDQSGRIAQLKFLETQYDALAVKQDKLRTAITAGEAALDGQRSSLQQIGSTAIAAADAQERLERAIENETRALVAQTTAAERNARVLETINRATGVNRDTGELQALNQQIEAHNQLIAKLRAEQDAQTELARVEEARRRAATLLPGASSTGGKSARESASVFQEADAIAARDLEKATRGAAAAEEELAAAAGRLRSILDPLATIQDRLNKELAEANALYRAGKISATELAMAEKLLAANAEKARAALAGSGAPGAKQTIFGLSPYSVQNLGYQVNDVVTQLASGTSLSQTLAQQGGQLIQIFPKVGASIVAAFTNPFFLGAAAVITGIVLALNEAAGAAERLRGVQAVLIGIGDNAGYSATGLTTATKALDNYSLSADQATKLVKVFINEGLAQDRIVQFGQAAKDMADVLGIDVVDAGKQLASAFTGGYDAIKKLDEATDLLRKTELDHIKTLFEEGKAQEARAYAANLVTGRLQDMANKQRGEWSEAVRSLSNAWEAFLTFLSNSIAIQKTIGLLDDLGKGVTNLFNRLSGAQSLSEVTSDIQTLEAALASAQRQLAQTPQSIPGLAGSGLLYAARAREVQRYARELDDLKKKRDELTAAERAGAAVGGDTVAQNTDRQAASTAALAERSRELAAARRDASDAERLGAAESQARREALRDLESDAYKLADEATKQAYVQQRIDEARLNTQRQINQEKETETRQAERAAREQMSALEQTKRLIMQKEGFRSTAYWDVNAYRTGYGSDTTTDANGRVSRVTAGTTTDQAGAVRDLERRIGEFVNVIKNQIGAERFGQFSAEQQAALTSIAYNYGSLPDRIIGAVRTGSSEEIAAAVRGLGGDNNGVNRARRNAEADILANPNQAVQQGSVAAIEQSRQQQDNLNQSIEQGNEARQRSIDALRAQNGLQGEALIAAQRSQAILDAEANLRKQAENANKNRKPGDAEIVITDEQIRRTRELTAAEFDLNNARNVAAARRQNVDQPVADLTARRDAIQAQIDALRASGDQTGAAALEASLTNINTQLQQAIANSVAFYQALAANPEAMAQLGLTATAIDNIVTKLQTAKLEGTGLGTQFLMTGKQINESFAQGAANAFDRFAQSVAEGKDVMSSLKDAFLQFAADFLRQIAQMIIKQAIFNAIGGATGTGGGGLGGGIASIIGGLFHTGGVAGQNTSRSREVPAALFANATRYHGGGVAGLKPNEVPAILEKGERIRTADQEASLQREMAASAAGGGGGTSVKNVILFDAADALAAGAATKVGERAILTVIRENRGAVQQAIQG